MQPRGLRNNNPLNLRISKNAWLGKVTDNTDGAFEQFLTLEYGIRAAFRNVKTIIARRQKNGKKTTIRDLISVWAPSADGNNEDRYYQVVIKKAGFTKNEILDVNHQSTLCKLLWAMAFVENGQTLNFQPFVTAYRLAFGHGYDDIVMPDTETSTPAAPIPPPVFIDDSGK